MIDEAPAPVVTPEKVREQRWILIAMFLVIFVGMCTLMYVSWGDASGERRFEAKLAGAAILIIALPLFTVLMVRGAHTRPYKKPRKRSGPSSAVMIGVFAIAPLIRANPTWEPVVWAGFAAFLLAVLVAFSTLFLVVSPSEEAARRQAAELT